MELGLILQDLAAKHLRCCEKLSDDQFAVLAGAVVEAVVGVRALEHSAAATIGSKESEAGIALLLVEAAKGGISGEDLEALLNEEFDIGEAKAKTLVEVYARNRTALTDVLTVHARASPVARLVGFNWRADHVISSSEDSAGSRQQFHVTLKTTGSAGALAGVGDGAAGGGEEEIKFTCDREQAQHLVGKLKEACRAAEKFAP